MMNKPLISKKIKLEKYPGKGGWTFARVPGIKPEKKNPFGWVKVRGTIDGFPIGHYHLMPMSDGKLFLPVKAATRKKIRKEAGDWVEVVLFREDRSLEIPAELKECLDDEPRAAKIFDSCSDSEKKYYIDWIYSAKREETRATRIAGVIERLLKDRKHPGKPGRGDE